MTESTPGRKIVIPIQFTHDSTLAVDLARAIARPGDEVVLIHVIPLLETSGMLLPKPVSVDSIIREMHDDAERRLEIAVEECAVLPGVRVSSICIDGNPGEEIVKYVSATGAWLVVMETAGKGAARRMMIGSVADHVARSSGAPVLLVRESEPHGGAAGTIRRIVVPVDPAYPSRAPLAFAAELADRLEIAIALISVRSIEQDMYLYGTASMLYASEEIDASAREATERLLESTAADLSSEGLTVSTTVLNGPVAMAIEDFLQAGDLIVMSSHGRSGIRRWLLGSVAEHLVRKGSAPVVLVPPAELKESEG